MAHDAITAARVDRNTALIDVMMLAATADGAVKPVELEQLLARVLDRPEFEGTSADELNGLIESSARRLASAAKLEDVLTSLRQRLPDHRNRLLAFGLACAVAFADHRASREELGLLKAFQAALGVSEHEVTQVIDVVQSGGSLAEALGEPLEQLLAEVMVLVSAADGVVHEKELLAMLESMSADPVFKGLSVEAAERSLQAAVGSLALEGMPSRLAVLARGLTTRAQKRKAFELALKVAHADGPPKSSELKVLELLQATFGLADDEVAKASGEM